MQIKTSPENIDSYTKYLTIKEQTHSFLKKGHYLEIDLPVLSPTLVPESYLEVFKTELLYEKEVHPLFLTPSPELFLKRILAYLTKDCYYLGKSFRNGETYSNLHSYEFTMLELYKLNANYKDIADVVLKLLQNIAEALNGKKEIEYQGKKVSLEKWEEMTIAQTFKTYSDISEDELFDHEAFIKKAQKKGYTIVGATYEDLFSQIYVQEIEPNLGMNGYPTILYDYPKEFAALAKLNADGKTAQRFEFYICGIELGDCYTELTNSKEQEGRFADEQKKRKELKRIDHPTDDGFITALEFGLPECSGIAIGFDRLAMIFADKTSIHDLRLIDIEH